MSRRFKAGVRVMVVVVGPVILAMGLSLLIIALAGASPIDALQALWAGAFGGVVQTARTISFLLPLSLVALGWIVAFAARKINVGFEGQIVVGGIAASMVGLFGVGLPGPLHLLAAVVAGTLAGALYGGIAAWLWAERHVNEIITTLLLNFVALELVSWLVRGPLHEGGTSFPRSEMIPAAARWPFIVENSPLSWAIAILPLAIFGAWLLLNKTGFGFAVRLTGANPAVSEYAGLNTKRITVWSLLISAALAGLAGSSLVLGSETGRLTDGFSAAFGFEGIVVALVARNNPLGVLPAALLFAILESGSGLMETRVGVAAELVLITQGVVILTVAAASFLLGGRDKATSQKTGTSPVPDQAVSS